MIAVTEIDPNPKVPPPENPFDSIYMYNNNDVEIDGILIRNCVPVMHDMRLEFEVIDVDILHAKLKENTLLDSLKKGKKKKFKIYRNPKSIKIKIPRQNFVVFKKDGIYMPRVFYYFNKPTKAEEIVDRLTIEKMLEQPKLFKISVIHF